MADDSVENESASSQQAKLENQDRPEDDKNSSANENAGASRESDSPATSNRNIKIGSQRDNAKQAEAHVAHGTESVTHVGKASGDAKDHKRLTQSKKPPTIDSVVTPELQKEIDQAIDDSQIDRGRTTRRPSAFGK